MSNNFETAGYCTRCDWGAAPRRQTLKPGKVMLSVIAGALVASLTRPTHALNGNVAVLSCACQTTSQFSAAAIQASNDRGWGGTFQVVSTSGPSSALMTVRGRHLIDKNGNDYWLASGATPIDASGTSLAGQAESAQESFYGSFDQTTFGVSRSSPTVVKISDEYAASFVRSTEDEVSPGIGRALILMGIDQGSIPPGTVITVRFPDGTTAEYIKQSNFSTYQWIWNGTAHDKNGRQIYRDGTFVTNSNTGGAGDGHANVPGFGSGASWGFGVSAAPTCTFITTITVNGDSTDYMYVHPC